MATARLTRSESRERNRRALLSAAAEVVLEHGFDAAMLTDIAERAGLTKGAIYSIFGSKRDLLIALVEDLFARAEEQPTESARQHAAAFEKTVRTAAGRRAIRLEVELAGLAMREPSVLAVVAERRAQRAAALGAQLGSEQVARALLALEQGWALELAFGGSPPPGELTEAAARLEAVTPGPSRRSRG